MKKILLMIFAFFLSLTLTGCGLQDLLGNKKQKSQSSSSQNQKPVIAVALNEQDPNKALILQGIEDMAQKENMAVKVISPGSTGGDQGSSQSDGESSKDRKSSGSSKNQGSQGQSSGGGGSSSSSAPLKGAKILIYGGGNPEILQSVQENQIPVLALNELPSGVKTTGIILPDPVKSGQLMAEPVLNKVTEGQVVVLQGDPADSASQETLASIKQVLSKNPKITVHALSNPAGSESVARQALIEFLQKNSGKVQAIMAQNEQLAAQAAEVLKNQQLEKKVLLVGGQANLQSLKRMAGGSQVADIDTSPYIQGVNAFQWAQKIVNKEPLDITDSVTGDQGEVPAKIIPVKSVTPENLSVVQKSYAKALEAKPKTTTQTTNKQASSGASGDQQGQNSQNQGSGQGQNQAGSTQGQGGPSANIPQGATKVNEKVQTIITREYLDAQGKVLGTEKSSSEQQRTVPPEMLKQQAKQQQQGQGQKGQEKDQQKSSDGGEGDQKDKKN